MGLVYLHGRRGGVDVVHGVWETCICMGDVVHAWWESGIVWET